MEILNTVFSVSRYTLQEMLDIMKSIYDMMGKYTYPTMQDDAPREHVESFFQVKHSNVFFPPHFTIVYKQRNIDGTNIVLGKTTMLLAK